MKWAQFQALVLRWKAWIQRQLFEDDPWDAETLFPESNQSDHSDESGRVSNAKSSDAEPAREKNCRAKLTEQKNRSNEE